MDTKYFALQHWVDTDLITLLRVSTSDNESDAMTKNLGRTLFYRRIDYIMGRVIPEYVIVKPDSTDECFRASAKDPESTGG